MAGVENHSEFDGGGVMPNTVYPKGNDALTPSDKLRLLSMTGQTEDSRAPVDGYYWTGATAPDPALAKAVEREQRQRAQALRRSEIDRYKESQY